MITVLFGTQTGNSKKLATRLVESLDAFKVNSRLMNMSEYNVLDLKKESTVLIIVSTQGMGEPPFMVVPFYEDLKEFNGSLNNLHYSILGLGDTFYEQFCQAATDLDILLGSKDANRILETRKCDIDYEEQYLEWEASVVSELVGIEIEKEQKKVEESYSKSNPFLAKVISKEKITKEKSNKEIYEVVLDLFNSNLEYEIGDSIGIYPENPTHLINQLIINLGLDKKEVVEVEIFNKKERTSVFNALKFYSELSLVSSHFLDLYPRKLEKEVILGSNLDVMDILNVYPVSVSSQELVDLLPRLQPRLYSISSIKNDRVTILTSTIRNKNKENNREGICTTYIADRVSSSHRVPVYVYKNPYFKYVDSIKPIIMIGTGVGIAPFMGFLEKIKHSSKVRHSWLIFGNQHKEYDFLYEDKILEYEQKSYLNKLSVVFSRDENKYVQDTLQQNKKEVINWIEEGTFIYVCGSLKMGEGVRTTLYNILGKEKYKKLITERKYLEDTY